MISLFCKNFIFKLQTTSDSVSSFTLPTSTSLLLLPPPPSPAPIPLLDSGDVVTSDVEAQTLLQVEWGKPTMIDAERRLLASALLDFSNERFVLLSETCIPLFNFTTVYNYLMNSNKSFLASYDDPRKVGRGRYNPQMDPTVTISDWRKGSQWFEVNRKLAIEIVSDTKYYPIFKEYCSPPCYMDEHYIPTLVNIIAPVTTQTGPLLGLIGPRVVRTLEDLGGMVFQMNC
ncbi:hypothetical protein J5N97_002037 [Dioscorea zingiberensis]|uniref:Uncharacterized protein n=1 Tax=Dioscorea zingiberensis TaxID=325984 RepID=A0A9D5BTD2_9LILI|nr:hypothetical protein J5N97_002037 [Dioscorea zingiberensis]